MNDVDALRQALAPIEPEATELPWAHERLWRTDTHINWEGDVPAIDLHDLNARLARQAIDHLLQSAPDLDTGAVRVITGRGRRSVGPGVLGDVVRSRIGNNLEAGWQLHPSGAGAFLLITDPRRAPHSATGALGWPFWLCVALVFALLFYVLLT